MVLTATPRPGLMGVVVGLALPRGAVSDSAAWCARRWPLRVDALVRWCVGQCVVPPPVLYPITPLIAPLIAFYPIASLIAPP